MEVDVNIRGTSPNFSVTYPAGPYTAPLTVKFINNSSSLCKLWYQPQGAMNTLSAQVNGGASFTVSGGLSFNVTPPGNVTPAMSHIIHVGS